MLDISMQFFHKKEHMIDLLYLIKDGLKFLIDFDFSKTLQHCLNLKELRWINILE